MTLSMNTSVDVEWIEGVTEHHAGRSCQCGLL